MSLIPLNIKQLKKKAKLTKTSPSGSIKQPIQRARRIIRILERDGYKCVECCSKENLTIDHINGRAFAKHNNASKYKPSECVTLCIKCHDKKNKEKKKEIEVMVCKVCRRIDDSFTAYCFECGRVPHMLMTKKKQKKFKKMLEDFK